MNVAVIVLGSCFALLSFAILSYVVLVSMMGPWIAPTLVLLASLIFKLRLKNRTQEFFTRELALIQSIGSVGGIVGTAIAFSLPMLYFLDAPQFTGMLNNRIYFCTMMGMICLVSGGLGMYLARMFSTQLMVREQFSFPVSTLIYRMITSQTQKNQAHQTIKGLVSTFLFCFIRDGFLWFKGLLPRTLYFFQPYCGTECALALFNGPTLWAIGFIAGGIIAKPLIVGVISKYLVLYPLNHHATMLPYSVFELLSTESFSMAFCSGLVVIESLFGIMKYPSMIYNTAKTYISGDALKELCARMMGNSVVPLPSHKENAHALVFKKNSIIQKHLEGVVVLLASFALLTYFQFPFLAQVCMLLFTLIATYQMSYISAKIGLLPFGRFSLFVMVPTMLLFKLTHLQLTILCMFVCICGGVASNLLFEYKVGEMCNITFKKIHRYQWLGLVITSCGVGMFLWLLFNTFEIGSPELFAKRGRTRALLIQATHFNFWALGMGCLYGYLLSKLKINPALTLGGILMPNSISSGLIIGGIISKFVKKPEDYTSFWSGVFASESLWVLIYIGIKFFGF